MSVAIVVTYKGSSLHLFLPCVLAFYQDFYKASPLKSRLDDHNL